MLNMLNRFALRLRTDISATSDCRVESKNVLIKTNTDMPWKGKSIYFLNALEHLKKSGNRDSFVLLCDRKILKVTLLQKYFKSD